MKVFIILGAINALLAVGLGAFGAHGLEGKIPDKYLQVWHLRCAVSYVSRPWAFRCRVSGR